MKTMQAEYKTDIAHLSAQLAERDARLEKELAAVRTEANQRDSRRGKELADERAEASRRETALLTRLTVAVGVAVAILSVVGTFLAFANRIFPAP